MVNKLREAAYESDLTETKNTISFLKNNIDKNHLYLVTMLCTNLLEENCH